MTFCFAQINANSIRSHIDLLKLHLLTNQYHIVSVSETWLQPDIPDNIIAVDGYFLIRHDRLGCRGGGVACYVSNSLAVSVLAVSSRESIDAPEFLLLDVRLPDNEHLLYASVYRRPKGLLFGSLFDVLNGFSHRFKHVIVSGDLNCNLLSNNFEACHLREITASHSLLIVPSDATHHTATSDSWLDTFIIDDLEKVVSFTKSTSPFIAGHDLLELSLQLGVDISLNRPMLRRNFRGLDVATFCDCVEIATGSDCDGANASELCSWLNAALIDALDVLAPSRSFVVIRSPFCWLSDDLRAMIKTKNRLFKRAKSSGLQCHY